MVWKSIGFRYPFLTSMESLRHEFRPLKVNENCYIRKEHKCGKMHSASKSCFIACSDNDEIQPILELISEKLTKVGVESIIAVKERAYGQDIFCTKICGKIIESKFCIVILDDSIEDDKSIPNPNVYYEYGLMTSLEKHIIPLQKENLKLAFNIQSHDTIKYNPKNIGTELDRAIKDAVKITDLKAKTEEEKEEMPEKTLKRCFEISNLEPKDSKWFLNDVIEDTNFIGFGQSDKKFYVYLGKIDDEKEIKTYLEDLNVVMYRTEKVAEKMQNKAEEIKKEIKEITPPRIKRKKGSEITDAKTNIFSVRFDHFKKELDEVESKINLMNTIYFGFIVNPEIKIDDFIMKAKNLLSKYKRYKLTYNNNNNNNKIIFGSVEVNLEFLNYSA